MNDWDILNKKLNAQRQQQAAAEQLRIKQEQANAIKNQPTGLAAVLNNIGEKIGDFGSTLNNIGKTIFGGFSQGQSEAKTKQIRADDSARRNEIAKRYGYNSYSDAMNDENASQDFWNEIKSSNQKTKDELAQKRESENNSYGNVKNIDLNKAKGQALNTIGTVLDVAPGFGIVGNALSGVVEGAGDAYKAAEGGTAADVWGNGNLNTTLGRMAAGGTSALVGGKVAKSLGPAKTLLGNIGKSAVSGAASGATSGGIMGLATGQDVLQSAIQGGIQGAEGGAVMGSVNALTSKSLNALSNRKRNKTAQAVAETPEAIAAKASAQDIAETPAAATRRSIPVTDYDAGEQTVKVKRANAPTGEYSLGKNAGSTLDGILGPNNARKLRNATLPSEAAQFKNATGTNDVYDYIGQAADAGVDVMDYMKGVLTPEDYAAFRQNAADYAALNQLGFEGTNAVNKTNLPQLDRQQYYDDTIGKLKAQGGSMSAADVPDYMKSHLKNDAAKTGGYISDNQSILRELFNDNQSDIGDLYKRYEDLAQAANQNEVYTPENMAAGLRMDDDLARRATDAILKEYGARRDIDVNAYPSLRKPVDVGFEGAPSDETVYTKRILPGKTGQNLPAPATPAQLAPIEDTPLIRKGTPEYEAIQRQEYIDNRARELRNTVTENVRNQYGTIRLNDRINGLDDAIMELAEYGLMKRSEIDGFANRITGKDGEMSKAIRKAMNNAGKTDGRLDITMDDVYRASGASGNKAATEKIKSKFNAMGKKYTVDADGGMNRSDMYNFGKELEREGYRNIERGGRTQNADTEVYGEAMRMLGEQYISKATDGVDMSKYINANRLKNLLPGNEAWAAHVDQSVPNIKTVSDARSFMAAPTKLSLLADAAEYNKGTYGSNMGNFSKDGTQAVRAITSASPIRAVPQFVAAKILDSDATRDRITRNAMKQYKNIEAGGTGQTGVKGAVKNIAAKAANAAREINSLNPEGNMAKYIAGQGELESPVGRGLLGKSANAVMDAAEKATILDAINPNATARIAAFNDRLTQPTGGSGINALGNIENRMIARSIANNTANRPALEAAKNELEQAQANAAAADAAYAQAAINPTATTQNTGIQQLQRISAAMDAALAAGDIMSYGKLADLYQQAYKIYGQGTTTTAKALSANQAKALTAQQQLEQLAQMSPDAGTALANSPLGFLVNLTGGNEYANQAKSLATTLGYLLSGANIKESEAERIGQAYVPTAFDSESVKQQKIARARQLIQSYLATTDELGA